MQLGGATLRGWRTHCVVLLPSHEPWKLLATLDFPTGALSTMLLVLHALAGATCAPMLPLVPCSTNSTSSSAP
jgi:hypothetical protein